MLERLSPLSPDCCIYRAPKQLRQAHENAFTPKIISIGPLHHGREDLQEMEEQKLWHLREFLQRTKVNLEDCIELIKKLEAQLRNCYAGAIQLNHDKFVEMILVDAAFIIEVLMRISFPELRKGDCILGRPRMLFYIAQDMLLLENQLPFFIIEDLLTQAFPPDNDVRVTLIKLCHNLLKSVLVNDLELYMEKLCSSRIEHLLDFARSSFLPLELPVKRKLKTLSIPNITQLYHSGVEFKVGKHANLRPSIRFENGILEISHLYVSESTYTVLRNLIAYELCHFDDTYINNCAFVMDRLINTPKDVEILIQNKILEISLPVSQGLATLVNDLAPEATILGKEFYFADLCEDLNAYCRVPRHKWKAILKRDYFSTPWGIISVIAATALLVVTIIQTVFTINSKRFS